MWFIYILSVCFLVSFSSASNQRKIDENYCETSEGIAGVCIPKSQCKYLDLKKTKGQSNSDYPYIVNFVNGERVPKSSGSNQDKIKQRESTKKRSNVQHHPNVKLVNEDICGKLTENRNLSGNKTGLLEFPWMALIFYKVNDKSKQVKEQCGGSIINKRYILTAAHCVAGHHKTASHLEGVMVGVHNLIGGKVECVKDKNGLKEEKICIKPKYFYVEKVEYHPDYSEVTRKNDIALLRLERNIDFVNSYIKPICLPIETTTSFTENTVIVAGWGLTESGAKNDVLLKNELPVIPNKDCVIKYPGLTDRQMCVGGKPEIACIGNTGGPLLSPVNYKYVQYGINSYGDFICNPDDSPIVYTKIAYYMDWILDTIRE